MTEVDEERELDLDRGFLTLQVEGRGDVDCFRGDHLLYWHRIFRVSRKVGIVDLLVFTAATNWALMLAGLSTYGMAEDWRGMLDVEPEIGDEDLDPEAGGEYLERAFRPPPFTPETRAAAERKASTIGDWYEVDDGLAVVRALIERCEKSPKKLAAHPHGAGIRDDLTKLELALLEAKRRGRRFRLRTREC